MNLEGKIVIVTGGSGLIGRYIMADLKRRGAIAINAEVSVRTNLELGEICCDITSVESIDLMRAFIQSTLASEGICEP
jgi:NAD(P)-dependent dehydrogenase (short-subunit alcohol dehydrogenase family)